VAFLHRLAFAGTLAVLLLVTPELSAGQPGTGTKPQPNPANSAPPPAATSPRSEQAYSLSPDKLREAIALSKIRVAVDIVGSIWGLIVLWGLLATGTATRLDGWTRERMKRGWLQGAVFFAVLLVILALANLPVDLVAHAASLHFRISIQAWAPWFVDQAKGLGVSLLIAIPLALFFNWIVRRSPRRYWLWIWIICLPLIVISVFLAPLVLDPIFNKFSPLETSHPRLVAKLEEVVARTGTRIPPSRMFLMKASEKSNGINAYVTGIGSSKRFVMWDTTMNRMPDDEIMFIFGHESGHYVLNHIPKGIALSMMGLFFMFWICAHFAEWMVRRFGERWHVGSVESRTGFLTLLFALSVAQFVVTPVDNAVSRHFEHEADVYGQEAVHGLVSDPQKTAVSSFNHLGEAWLDDPNPNAFVEFWSYSHPSVQDRAQFAEHYNPWANGGHGRFFMK
jgi:Zn-dependent protease with chaperone function